MSQKLNWIMLATLLLSACAPGVPSTPENSGITDQALVGPMCPVVREGQDCPDRPYQATLTILDRTGKVVLQFQTDEQGEFRVPLAPGEYILRPETPEGLPYPVAGEQAFQVLTGVFTPLTVSYDSGIR